MTAGKGQEICNKEGRAPDRDGGCSTVGISHYCVAKGRQRAI